MNQKTVIIATLLMILLVGMVVGEELKLKNQILSSKLDGVTISNFGH